MKPRLRQVLIINTIFLVVLSISNIGSAEPVCKSELVPLSSVEPIYPPDSARHGYSWVVVEFLIDVRGLPQKIKVLKSSTSVFERSAMTAIQKWRYPPRETSCIHQVKIEYIFEDAESSD